MAIILTRAGEQKLGITEIEELMNKLGVHIEGSHLELHVNGKAYHVGRDCCEFPRTIDEPLRLF
jgi:hypothetical protein